MPDGLDLSSEPVRCVELRAARVPWFGLLAHHHWFVIGRDDRRDRWEVWQTANAGGVALGHLHRNLFEPERGVGSGPGWLVRTWEGDVALHLARRIETASATYPWCHHYRYWPGPNCNTFVQWVLGPGDQPLGRRALGKRYVSRMKTSGG